MFRHRDCRRHLADLQHPASKDAGRHHIRCCTSEWHGGLKNFARGSDVKRKFPAGRADSRRSLHRQDPRQARINTRRRHALCAVFRDDAAGPPTSADDERRYLDRTPVGGTVNGQRGASSYGPEMKGCRERRNGEATHACRKGGHKSSSSRMRSARRASGNAHEKVALLGTAPTRVQPHSQRRVDLDPVDQFQGRQRVPDRLCDETLDLELIEKLDKTLVIFQQRADSLGKRGKVFLEIGFGYWIGWIARTSRPPRLAAFRTKSKPRGGSDLQDHPSGIIEGGGKFARGMDFARGSP